ncbi:thymidine phosphorylase [Alkalimonas collagenimarina]|uniref:Thymidine phosphorylase n=1 Tax=Alkalimonas collagenimarina TaxID=400390 RepID=A0ABT9GXI2_9GAMM|nr:thymidine phosphorylase [Alkalimonas collagenimarina]MDP4535673.1 thymidine phosphorylase [Alkalimonas collagenimarina]
MPIPQEIIKIKRNGKVLSQANIQQFAQGLTDGSFSDSQAAALAMAIYLNGMSVDEKVALTLAMRDSGTSLNWQGQLSGPVVDKHSTGGVGDKVTLMLAPMVAACGAFMPSIAGRGLGHTGGTVDKLEAIPGYSCNQSLSRIRQLLPELGCLIVGQTDELAPADRRLYGIRDVTATVESIPLITASILSKKLSEGLDALVMDVKVGNGAIMATAKDADALARSIVDTACGAGVPTRALITDMNQILGSSAGNALEVLETLDYLTGKQREPRLHQLTLELGADMLLLSGLQSSRDQAMTALQQSLDSGHAAEYFARMVAALGGPTDLLEKPTRYLAQAPVVLDVLAPAGGVLHYTDTVALGMAVVRLGGGRAHPDQVIDPAVGLSDIVPAGQQVSTGQRLARVHAASAQAAEQAVKDYLAACRLSVEPLATNALIHQRLG